MTRITRMTLLVASISVLVGCEEDDPKIIAADLLERTVTFVPDVAMGGIDTWYYDFPAPEKIFGCNVEANYDADSWEIDEETRTVTIHFGAQWEKYQLIADDESLLSGRFEYDSSVGVQMSGSWSRDVSPFCAIPYSDGNGGGGARAFQSYCVCTLDHVPPLP